MEQKKEEPVVSEPANKEEESKMEEIKAEEKKEGVADYSQGMPISDLVNKEFVELLMSYGFTKVVSEKALYLTGNSTVEKAMDWIENHQQDPDYEEELRIVGKVEEPKKPALSEAEAKKKARELQEQIRKRMKEKEEAMEREREKEQMKGGKALADAKAKYEEANIIREAEKRRKEKMENERAMRAMEERLRRDKEERFGKEFTSTGKPAGASEKTPIQKAQHGVKMIKELYPEFRHPNVAENCFKLLKAYLSNLLKDSENEKFKKINKENKAFMERVAKVEGGNYFLKAVGFEDDGSFLVIKKVDIELIKSALALLN